MSKRWTLKDDLLLAEYEGMDANFIAEHDLGRDAKGAGVRRVKTLKDAGVWELIQAHIKARDIMRCRHTLAFNTSNEAKTVAAQKLRELGADLPSEGKALLEISDEANRRAEIWLAAFDAAKGSAEQRREIASKAVRGDAA